MKILLCVMTFMVLALTGCSNMRAKIEPQSAFEDPSESVSGLGKGLLDVAACSSPQSASLLKSKLPAQSLPGPYLRFATAAFCAYALDLEAYTATGFLNPPEDEVNVRTLPDQSGKKRATSGNRTAAAKSATGSDAKQDPATPANKDDAAVKAGNPASADPASASKGLEVVKLSTSAVSPTAQLHPLHYQWMHGYMESGLELIRFNCEDFFNHRERDRVNADYFLATVSTIISAATAIRTYGGENARSAFNLATLQTGVNSAGADYKSNYLFTPELGRLYERLEREVFSQYRDLIRQDFVAGKYVSFSQVTQDLQRYEDLCSRKSIGRTLAEAMDYARFQPVVQQSSPAELAKARQIVETFGEDDAIKKKTLSDWKRWIPSLLEFSQLTVAERGKLVASDPANPVRKAMGEELAVAVTLGLAADNSKSRENSRKLTQLAALLDADDDARHALAAKQWKDALAAIEAGNTATKVNESKAFILPRSLQKKAQEDFQSSSAQQPILTRAIGETRVFGIEVSAKGSK